MPALPRPGISHGHEPRHTQMRSERSQIDGVGTGVSPWNWDSAQLLTPAADRTLGSTYAGASCGVSAVSETNFCLDTAPICQAAETGGRMAAEVLSHTKARASSRPSVAQ